MRLVQLHTRTITLKTSKGELSKQDQSFLRPKTRYDEDNTIRFCSQPTPEEGLNHHSLMCEHENAEEFCEHVFQMFDRF